MAVDVDAVDAKGNSITLRDVVGFQDLKTGKVYVDPVDVARREIEQMASEFGVSSRAVPILLLLRAQAGVQQRGGLFEKYRWNKALFYLWKKLDGVGLGEVLPRDSFMKMPRGPVPEHLDEDLGQLEVMGVVKVDWRRRGDGTKVAHDVSLTLQGDEIAGKIWALTPMDFLETATWVKTHVVPQTVASIMKEVHRDYPEWTYREPDDEGA